MHEGSDRAVPSLAQLLTGIINDAKTLVRHELALATDEIREELRNTKAAMLSLVSGSASRPLAGCC